MFLLLSAAGAALTFLSELPAGEKTGLYAGMAACLFIFLLFPAAITRKISRKRAEKRMEETIRHLRELNIWEERHG